MNLRLVMFTAMSISLVGCATAPPTPPGPTTDQRLNTATRTLHSDIQDLRDEVKELRNQLELKSYEVDKLKARLDASSVGTSGQRRPQRFGQLRRSTEVAQNEPPAESAPAMEARQMPASQDIATEPAGRGETAVATQAQSDAPTPLPDQNKPASGEPQAEYDQAFNLLKQSRFDDSYNAFQSFLLENPDSPLADNAQYWSGEALYAMREFDRAVSEFDKVVQNFPDSDKAPEAMLKKGYSYYEMGDLASAEAALNDVVAKYPGTRVSVSAQNRLTQIASDKRQQGAGQ